MMFTPTTHYYERAQKVRQLAGDGGPCPGWDLAEPSSGGYPMFRYLTILCVLDPERRC